MNFHFQSMKPVMQAEFDEIFQHYPTDMSAIIARVPVGGDPYVRKLATVEAIAELAPVHVFPHYPFAYEVDAGVPRDQCHNGIGVICGEKSGVDRSAFQSFAQLMTQAGICSIGSYTDNLHRTLDHDTLLSQGFRGVYERCQKLNKTETDAKKRRYREVLMRICLAARLLGQRMREQAAEKLTAARDADAVYNLSRIVNSPNTPWEPAATMFDALNSLLCASCFISHMDGVGANCFGQVDRLVQPYYEADLAAGRVTEEEARFLIHTFLFKSDGHAHYNEKRTTYDNGVTVMIGGQDMQGNPIYNDITRMIMDAYAQTRFINPKLNARACAASPKEYLLGLARLMIEGSNSVIMENDEYIVPMFERMGLKSEDARRYAGNGCQEVICPHQLHSRAFIYLNLAKVLVDTLNYARTGVPADPYCQIYNRGKFDITSFEALMDSYLTNLRSFIATIAENLRPMEALHPQINPEPIHSCFTDDCVARGQDIAEGGALYNNKTFAMYAFGTLCDSLLALRKAYEEGTVDTLLAATDANFEGYEVLRSRLQSGPNRFGHSEEADQFAAELAHHLSQVSRGIYNADGIEWRTSLFTYYIFSSRNGAATPDGRLAGSIYSRQMNMAAIPDLTQAAISMSKICDLDFNDVGMFDISLPLGGGEAAVQAMADYLAVCVKLRIPVLQVNVADRQKLVEERQHHGTHPDLVVRVCGFSAYFAQLGPVSQDEIISRLGA